MQDYWIEIEVTRQLTLSTHETWNNVMPRGVDYFRFHIILACELIKQIISFVVESGS